VTRLQRALRRLSRDLDDLGQRWALIGGLAVSARAEPRTTRDVDVAIAVVGDRDAESLVKQLVNRGYRFYRQLEHTDADRLAGTRLLSPEGGEAGLIVDLLFASSGIEEEVVRAAQNLELTAGWSVPVARTGHLLALKVLSSQPERPEARPQDIPDALALIQAADPEEMRRAREGLDLIALRGFARGKDLQKQFGALLQRPAKVE
jgi:hypothetical protein